MTKLNATGTSLDYSTYVGSAQGSRIALDVAGNAYVAGSTSATNFPTTAGAFQASYGGGAFDAVVAKLNAAGTGVVYATYLGGSGTDFGNGIAVDALGAAYVTGQTDSPDFPTIDAFQPVGGGSADGFVTKVDATGGGLAYSSYLGGGAFDRGLGIALDGLPSPNVYVTGQTASSDFPVTAGAFQTFRAGDDDVFVTKIGGVPAVVDPTDKSQCKNGGWAAFGFKNQGQCVRFVETGKDSRAGE